ncbi:MAG: response regulator [Acidobacteriota bacterium]|nr:response regulator [Acidobacteriota bacterium]
MSMEQHTTGPLVMVVDDLTETRLLLRKLLEESGWRVVEAVNGRDALEVAAHTQPALILMDLNMPVLDGFSATLHLRGVEGMRHVPVIAITAHDSEEFRAAARAVGCAEFVVKPIDFDRLTILMERLIKENPALNAEPVFIA